MPPPFGANKRRQGQRSNAKRGQRSACLFPHRPRNRWRPRKNRRWTEPQGQERRLRLHTATTPPGTAARNPPALDDPAGRGRTHARTTTRWQMSRKRRTLRKGKSRFGLRTRTSRGAQPRTRSAPSRCRQRKRWATEPRAAYRSRRGFRKCRTIWRNSELCRPLINATWTDAWPRRKRPEEGQWSIGNSQRRTTLKAARHPGRRTDERWKERNRRGGARLRTTATVLGPPAVQRTRTRTASTGAIAPKGGAERGSRKEPVTGTVIPREMGTTARLREEA